VEVYKSIPCPWLLLLVANFSRELTGLTPDQIPILFNK